MTENDIRVAFAEAAKDKETPRGFWHTRTGREIRKNLNEVSFANFETVQEKVWSLTNNNPVRPLCIVCKTKSASFYQYGFLETCGNLSCSNKLAVSRIAPELQLELQQKRVKASLTDESKSKRKESLTRTLKLRGEEIRAKSIATCLAAYGVVHHAKSVTVQEKIAKTNLDKYGTSSVLSVDCIRKLGNETRRLYYETNKLPGRLARYTEYTPLFTEWHGVDYDYGWQHNCGHIFKQSLNAGCAPECPACKPRSKPERFIADYLMKRGIPFKHNDRTLLKPYEIDVLIESHKLAIEINGAYWHREGSHSRPLLEKTEQTESHGYQLLHFWDFEITEKPEIVKSIIDSKLGIIANKIGASRCKIIEVDTKTATQFINDNHLSGNTPAKFKYGLSYSGELVAIATFSKARFSKEDVQELVRFCVKRNYHVHGALSKLIKHAVRLHNTDIISFADRRISNGRGYIVAGFNVVSTTSPNYWYCRDGIRLPRYAAMKHKLPKLLGDKFNAPLTERENMDAAGYLLIKDSGNIKLRFNSNK